MRNMMMRFRTWWWSEGSIIVKAITLWSPLYRGTDLDVKGTWCVCILYKFVRSLRFHSHSPLKCACLERNNMWQGLVNFTKQDKNKAKIILPEHYDDSEKAMATILVCPIVITVWNAWCLTIENIFIRLLTSVFSSFKYFIITSKSLFSLKCIAYV